MRKSWYVRYNERWATPTWTLIAAAQAVELREWAMMALAIGATACFVLRGIGIAMKESPDAGS